MISGSNNSGGVVVGLLHVEQNVAGLISLYALIFFSLVEIFLSSREPFQHGASIACCNLLYLVAL